MTNRKYTTEQKVDAVALSLSIGVLDASKRLGIPHTTISKWRAHPDMRHVIANTRAALSRRLNEAYSVALAEVVEGLQNPKAALGHKAKALEVLGNQRALIEGEPTERIESANLNVQLPAGAEPVLSDTEARLLERYLRALESGSAIAYSETIDTEYARLEAGDTKEQT